MKYLVTLFLMILISCGLTPNYEIGQCVVAEFSTLDSSYSCSHIWRIASISVMNPTVYASYPSIMDQQNGCPSVRLLLEQEIKYVVECPKDFYDK